MYELNVHCVVLLSVNGHSLDDTFDVDNHAGSEMESVFTSWGALESRKLLVFQTVVKVDWQCNTAAVVYCRLALADGERFYHAMD